MNELNDLVLESEPVSDKGSCLLKIPEISDIVQQSLLFFEGKRYYLLAWCIMPNHVHLVIAPLGVYSLSSILHSIKSYTSNQINKRLNRKGMLWGKESFTHLIRTFADLEKFVYYTENNPVEAGLCDFSQKWPYSSCTAGFQPAKEYEFIEPKMLPFSPLMGRGKLPQLFKEGGTYFVTFCLADALFDRSKK